MTGSALEQRGVGGDVMRETAVSIGRCAVEVAHEFSQLGGP